MRDDFMQCTMDGLQEAYCRGMGATDLGRLAKELLGSAFGPISFAAAFRGAFGIPLDILQQALAWQGFRVGERTISDEEFTDLLADWICDPGARQANAAGPS